MHARKQATGRAQSNGPVMAEWTRGTSGGQSGVSIGFAADPEADDRTLAAANAATEPQANNIARQANDAKDKRNASDVMDRNCQETYAGGGIGANGGVGASELLAGDRQLPRVPSLEPLAKERPRSIRGEDWPASQYATLVNGGEPNEENKDEEGTVVARKAMSSANGPDSMSAISKAGKDPRESQQDIGAAGYHSKLNDAQVRDSINQVKPTESLSSAAAGVFPGSYAAAMATAASLVSQNTGRAAMMNKSLSSEIPIDTNEALNALTHLPSPANNAPIGAASQNQAHARSPRFADHWPGSATGVSNVARPSRMGQVHQGSLQNQMQNSSNSGNHQQKISSAHIPPKNKSFSSATKKHRMRPPPSAAAAAIARMNVALPTGSSSKAGGIQIQLDQLAHTAEDAVSTMQPEACEFLEVACDAVSKASGEAHAGDKEENGYTESRVVQSNADERNVGHGARGTDMRRVTRSMAKRSREN